MIIINNVIMFIVKNIITIIIITVIMIINNGPIELSVISAQIPANVRKHLEKN